MILNWQKNLLQKTLIAETWLRKTCSLTEINSTDKLMTSTRTDLELKY